MSKKYKITIGIFLVVLFLSAGVIGFYDDNSIADEVFINQMGEEVRLKDFKDKVVLINFIYTSCPNKGCYLVGMQLLRVQLLLKNRIGKDLFLLSFSIDPEKDTPEVLREYAKRFKVLDSGGWFFLTGNPEAIDRYRKKHGVVWETGPDGKRFHRVAVVLLNQKGETEKVYKIKYKTKKIVEDIKALLNNNKMSTVNMKGDHE